jgi:hypothetical protein
LGAFVELAAILDGRLRPETAPQIADRVQTITTVDDAREYLVEVAARLRAAGVQ